ncbi:hypothetical protein TorRG33x02_077380 [Trema orientale]|uniref:Aminotransferase-like mobile domain containing protein n=1 Tax=Trema orientale TaxID=63057 RepID=A0A2P5FF94_TREOI|nr:hypothetical protein TorRG33x02_077380 [Trema orientale]
MIMGIKDRGKSIEFQGVSDISDLKDAIIGDKCRVSLSDLEEQLQDLWDADDLFLARFTLLAIGAILCPLTGIHLSNLYLNAVSDIRNLGKKNWASHAVRHLMESIRRYQVKHAKNLSGCTIYLQLLYLHHVEWQTGYVDRSIHPIDLWDFE